MQMIARAGDEDLIFRIGRVYERAAGWVNRKPPIEARPAWSPPRPQHPQCPGIDAQWVLQAARLNGLTFVDDAMAGEIAGNISSVKAMLGKANDRFKKFAPESLWDRYLTVKD